MWDMNFILDDNNDDFNDNNFEDGSENNECRLDHLILMNNHHFCIIPFNERKH